MNLNHIKNNIYGASTLLSVFDYWFRVVTLLSLGVSSLIFAVRFLLKYKKIRIVPYKILGFISLFATQGLWSGLKYFWSIDDPFFSLIHIFGFINTLIMGYLVFWLQHLLRKSRIWFVFLIIYSWVVGWIVINYLFAFLTISTLNPILSTIWPEFMIMVSIGTILIAEFGRIAFNRPKNARKLANQLLFSVAFATFLPVPLDFIFDTTAQKNILLLIGFWWMMTLLIKHPEFFFFAENKVFRLMIINTRSGISLYDHIWRKSESDTDEVLISGMFQGVSMILHESLNQGQVQEITLEQAQLTIFRIPDVELGAILISTTTNMILKDALRNMAVAFVEKYRKILHGSDISAFSSANELLQYHFSFIPQYE